MFDSVNEKFKAAEYFLDQLRSLEKQHGNFASIPPFSMRVNLDGFFFEIISAKDFFLREINDKYGGGVSIKCPNMEDALLASSTLPDPPKKQVKRIKDLLSKRESWLWRLNNYRNSSTHRHLIPRHFSAVVPNVVVYLFDDPENPSKGHFKIEIKSYCEESLRQMRKFLEDLYSNL